MFFKKIVYFDEQAATDILLEKNNGELTNTTKRAKELFAGADASAGGKTPKFLEKLLSISLSGSAKGSASTIAQTQLKSSILTEFLELADKKQNTFLFDQSCSVKITEDSLAFIRSAGKFLKMFKSGKEIDSDLQAALETLNVDNLDKILDQASGYYRMIGKTTNTDQEFIVRFNFAGIRNNYKLIDLPQMKLRIIGVKVGTINSLNIGLESELEISQNEEEGKLNNDQATFIDDDLIDSSDQSMINKRYDIVDAIIAGVE